MFIMSVGLVGLVVGLSFVVAVLLVRDALDLVVSVLVDGLRFVVGQVLVAVALLVVLVLQRIGEAQAQGRGEDQILQDQIVGGIISNRAQTSTNCFRCGVASAAISGSHIEWAGKGGASAGHRLSLST